MAFCPIGIGYLGPFPTAIRQLKFLVVDVDYFTKWVEAKALATITEKNMQIRYTQSTDLKQWEAIRQQHIQRLLLIARDQQSLFITRPPSSQWTS